MLSSFQAKDLRAGDRINVQTFTGKHTGTVSSEPRKTKEIFSNYAVSLDCSECESRHAVNLPAHRLIAAERTP